MTIADIEQAAFGMQRKVKDRAWGYVRQIHVAAVIVRLQRGNRLDLRRNPDGADEWLVGQNDLVAPAHAVSVDMHHPHPLRQRRIEHRGRSRSDQPAEFRNDAGLPGGLRAAGFHCVNMHGEAIALLDAADGHRAALRIEKGKLQFRGRTVLLAGDDTAEGVFGLDHDDVAGIDREHGLGIGPVDIMEITLRRDRKLVALAGLTLGEPALCHDRSFQPGGVGHGHLLNHPSEGWWRCQSVTRWNASPAATRRASSRWRPTNWNATGPPLSVKPPGSVMVGLPVMSKGQLKRKRPVISPGFSPKVAILASVGAANVWAGTARRSTFSNSTLTIPLNASRRRTIL